MQHFEHQVAVITGAAGGLGLALAHHAASLGMKLVLADVDANALEVALQELSADGTEVIGVVTDVADPAQLDRLAAAALQAYGRVHLLFNNAGVGAGGLIWENTANDVEWVFGVNVAGVLNGLRAFVPLMLAQGEPAHIVNTASVAGMLAAPMLGLYNASKHAVVGLSETDRRPGELLGFVSGLFQYRHCRIGTHTPRCIAQYRAPDCIATHPASAVGEGRQVGQPECRGDRGADFRRGARRAFLYPDASGYSAGDYFTRRRYRVAAQSQRPVSASAAVETELKL